MPRRPACLLLLSVASLPALAQRQRPAPPIRLRAVTFPAARPILGLPAGVNNVAGLCSSDGLTYFDTSQGSSSPGDFYTVSTTAEVKHLQRKLPTGYNEVTVLSFYPSSHNLITLLRAQKMDDPKGRPTETTYFLSLSDHDGDQADLLELRLAFKPLIVAGYGSGDFVAFGLDTANRLPVLARLREDGTVRRYTDLGNPLKADTDEKIDEKLASQAVFVPYGDNIMMTFPGTTRAVRVLHSFGEDSVYPIDFPPGWVLHDVLGSEGRSPIVARIQAIPASDKPDAPPPPQRMIQVGSVEYTFDKLKPANVTCSAVNAITAVYLDTIGTPAGDKGTTQLPPADPPKQLMIGTMHR